MAYLYLFVVNHSVICEMNPGVEDTSWSTDTTSPDSVITLGSYVRVCLPLHGLLAALTYIQADHIDILHFLNLLGMTPVLDIS